MNIFRRTFLLVLMGFLPMLVRAQAVKLVAVSASDSFTDHLALDTDSKDTDLMVKFMFNEQENTLTVSLISYRRLFVFQDDTRYKQVVRHRRLRPERFPYVVNADEKQRFKLSKNFRASLPKPHRKHVFKRWISYEGLVPVPTELTMVNDFIEQKFDIKNRQNVVTVTFGDVFLLEQDAKHSNRYWLVGGKNFNTKYEVTIVRDPCFGLETELEAATKSLADLQKSYKPFRAKFSNKKVNADAYALFDKMKKTLLLQFPPRTAQSPCPALQDTWNQYNQVIDSISQTKCTLETVVTTEAGEIVVSPGTGGLDAANILGRARQIDELVSRWLLTSDDTERKDLYQQCEQTIKDTNTVIRVRGVQNDEQRRAVKVFKAAEQYFKSTCTK